MTSTETPTSSFTQTDTPTSTASYTFTFTQTPTYTLTPTITFSFTSSPTPTLTPTLTSTATNTATATISFTATLTLTPTNSATAVKSGIVIGLPYPNPVVGAGPVSIRIQVPSGSWVEWSVFTTAFRRILDISNPVSGNDAVLVWNLEDHWQNPVANGLYYLRVQINGSMKTSKIQKILVIR